MGLGRHASVLKFYVKWNHVRIFLETRSIAFPGSMMPPKLVRGAGGLRNLKSPQGSKKPPGPAKKWVQGPFLKNVIYLLFLAALGLRCCTGFFSVAVMSWTYSPVAVHRLLIEISSLVSEHGL